MNWTEGNLSRHSRGRQRNELLTRQKQHFAKVRNGLFNGGVKKSPISISFLGPGNSRGSRHRDGSGGVQYRPLSSPLLVEKRKRAPDVSGDFKHQSSIREKRRRLLDQQDWVGLNLQQPIDITFPRQLQPLTGSRWARSGRSRPRAVQRRHESPSSPLQEARGHPFKIQIGSQEINPSLSTVSRRYSLAPQPLASSSQIRSNPISSPEPSHARHLYVAPTRSNKSPRITEDIMYETGEQYDTYPKGHVRPLEPEEPTYVVHSSSIIHEPVPRRRYNNFMVLDWSPASSGSEDWGSMRVEIERPARPAPSQEADQEFWKNLVPSSSDNLPIDAAATLHVTTSSSTSGTSVLPSNLQARLPSYDISSEPVASMSYQFPDSSTSSYDDIRIPIYEEDAAISSKNESNNKNAETQLEYDNDAWMKFVFGGDSEDLEARAFTEAAQQAAAELRPPDTHTFAVSFTENSAVCGVDSFGRGEKDDSPHLSCSSESHMATQGTLDSEAVSSNLATAGSTTMTEQGSPFRFAQPRTFVGKLANSSTSTTHGPKPTSNYRGEKRGRHKRKATDGRTDIRQLPDFDGDPIEEFEDE
ncbi:uncharacterized protein F4807DRAFT_465199 [Annulohypoxylon truncatum]|uniref:uncharacterized protein n=1 Tax=Annulohypoxylon truncatum TaxID=327061 RepID=UPI0020089571|nr:uncharacterized protein F4807DRAFT_465199 [Annulohypoxylon truncatum]KAI1204964.1 hypothetical protein F4807DRAFT_465199 [Annulohypoxylon truncatum]